MIALWVALGAAVGAPARYLTDRALQRRLGSRLPVGTLAVNLVASLVLGLLVGASGVTVGAFAFVGTGFCGALSTWSTFGFEVVGLARLRARAVAATYLVVSLVGGIGLAALGYALA
nr:fluoride efflux transporter CrcB [uncultured bacterium]